MTTRTETDPLGDLEVPASALYGVQTQRAVENFDISGIGPHPAFVWATVVVKKAAAIAHRRTGRLDAGLADAIVQAADEVLVDGQHQDQFVVDVFQAGAGTSHNMNANELLANRANELLGGDPAATTIAGASQRPRKHGAVDQRHHSDGHRASRPASACKPLYESLDGLAEAFAGEEVGGMGRHRQVGPDARAGRHPGAPGTGVRGLRGVAVRRGRERSFAAAEAQMSRS